MKYGEEHRVPLSDAALNVLRHMNKASQFVFPGQRDGRPFSAKAPRDLSLRMNCEVTPHGFRASFRTWVAERTNFPRELAEKALAHTVGDETERAYQRGDLFDNCRELMDTWAQYCEPQELATIHPPGKAARQIR